LKAPPTSLIYTKEGASSSNNPNIYYLLCVISINILWCHEVTGPNDCSYDKGCMDMAVPSDVIQVAWQPTPSVFWYWWMHSRQTNKL